MSLDATNSAEPRTELPLYWKDVRRVLFGGSAYSVYARLSRPGIQTSWSPVKLADVFDRFLPEVGDQIRDLPYLFERARSVTQRTDALAVSEVLRDKALVPFGRDLAQLATRVISAELLSEVSTDAAKSVGTLEELQDIGIVRRAFEKVVAAVEASPSLTESTEPAPIDRQLVRTLRQAYQAVARLALLNESAVADGPEGNEENAPVNFLEAEVVAIYW